MTGPVWIDGAMPGDALKVTILALRPSGWGWTGNIPGFGLLTDQFPDARLHHWHYDPALTPAMYGPGGRVPLRPFTGTIGVAPAEPGLHSIIPPRNVGGNMDARDICAGTELYLPVEVEGALFSVGDTHAAQGDGEVCGTAIESPIDVALKFELVKGARLRSPRYVTQGPVTDHFDKQGLRGDDRHRPGPDGRCAHGRLRDGRAALQALRLRAGGRLHALQRLRRPAHQLDRRRAELGRLVHFPRIVLEVVGIYLTRAAPGRPLRSRHFRYGVGASPAARRQRSGHAPSVQVPALVAPMLTPQGPAQVEAEWLALLPLHAGRRAKSAPNWRKPLADDASTSRAPPAARAPKHRHAPGPRGGRAAQ